jgi:hypothetical protein
MHLTDIRTNRRHMLAAALAVALATSAGGASAASARGEGHHDSAIPVVSVSVDSQAIHGPDRLRPGITTFHTSSTHPGTDSLAVVRLNNGVTYAQIFDYLAAGDLGAVFAHVSGRGGIAHGGPTNGSRWTTNLTRGRYLYVDDEANLFAELRVAGERQHAHAPRSDGTILFADGTFTLPRDFGSGTWRLHNTDPIQHELGLVRINGGHTRLDVQRVLAAGTHPGWLEPQGTVNLIGTGETAWVTLRHIHGFYVFLDYLPMFQGAADGPLAKFRRID